MAIEPGFDATGRLTELSLVTPVSDAEYAIFMRAIRHYQNHENRPVIYTHGRPETYLIRFASERVEPDIEDTP